MGAELATNFSIPTLELNIALGYGGRADILQAVKLIGQDVASQNLKTTEISDDLIFQHLKAPNQRIRFVN